MRCERTVSCNTHALSLHHTESLKNALLVMHARGTFSEATERTGQDLWGLTWAVIDSCRPGLRAEMTASLAG